MLTAPAGGDGVAAAARGRDRAARRREGNPAQHRQRRAGLDRQQHPAPIPRLHGQPCPGVVPVIGRAEFVGAERGGTEEQPLQVGGPHVVEVAQPLADVVNPLTVEGRLAGLGLPRCRHW